MNPNLLHQELAGQLHAELLRDATANYARVQTEPRREPKQRRPLLRFFRRPAAARFSS